MWPPCKKFPGWSGKAPVRGQPPPHGAGIGRGTGFSHVPCSPAKIFKISRYKAGAMRFLPHMDQGPGPYIPAPPKEDDGDKFPVPEWPEQGAVRRKPR
nr:MAG TPA: hypothetical protein [Caudoviricetes sp.]